METKVIKIEGMTCGHCVMTVRKQLSKMPEVFVEEVEIGKAVVKYDTGKVKDEDVLKAIEDAGYTVISMN